MRFFDSKLPRTGDSIFSVMSRMAEEHKAINLSQGFPDFNPPNELISLVAKYVNEGPNQYAPMSGVSKLREKISEKIKKLYGRTYDPETEITVTAGATQAIFTAVSAVINPGDEAVLLEPAYDSYAPSVLINKGVPVFIPLNEKDFSIDWDKVKNNISSRTKLIIINSPHNPTGSVISEADVKILEEIVQDFDLHLISDEVYEHITFDGHVHLSISSSEILSERAFVISSFGKIYHSTGWKIGYCAAPKTLTDEFRKIHQFAVFSVNTPIQHAYADYLHNEDHYLELSNFYQKKRDLFLTEIEPSRFSFKKTAGTYFQLLDYSKISEINDMDFCKCLAREEGIAAIPLSPFYSKKQSRKLIRICFAKREEVLLEATERLQKI